MNIYGVLDRNDCHIDVSTSLKGTKRYATRNGYTKVSIRYNAGYIADILFEKVNGKWVEYNPPLLEDELDLFADYENLPGEVQAILDKHCTGDQTYEDCAALVRDLEAVGYTCDYGLDAEPHSLRKRTYCVIRKDLQDTDLGTPVGDTYVFYLGEAQRFEYRWLNNDKEFQIFLDGEWLEADSIDFDFPNNI